MFDFTGEKKPLTESTLLVEAVINYDTSDLSYMLQESEMSVDNNVKAFQVCVKKAITESGVDSPEMSSILEAANQNIGQKILTILKNIKEWVIKQAKAIAAALQSFYENNLNVVTKIGKKVEERNAKGDYKDGPTAELYNYTYDTKVSIMNVAGLIEMAYKGDGYDLTGPYSEKKDSQVAAAKAAKSGEVKLDIIKKAYSGDGSGSMTLDTFKTVIHAGIRGDGKRHTVKFSTKFLVLLGKDNSAAAVKKLFATMMSELDKEEAEVKSNLTTAKTEALKGSTIIGYYNEKVRLLSAAIDAVISLNAIKIQAANEEVNEAKKFVVKAFTYRAGKALKESSEESHDSPYAFSLIESSIDELVASDENLDIDGINW